MPTPRKAGRFGGSAAHHKHIVANLATELIRNGRIRTTHARAKTVQPTAERLITFAKRGDLHARRQAGRIVRDGDVLHHLFDEVGPAFADRDGGYTRVLKLGPRKGDAAPMALIELVADVGGGDGEAAESERRGRWSLRRQRSAAESGAATAEGEPEAAASDEADEERPEVDPADVEARFAAEEADEAGEPEAAAEGAEEANESDSAEDDESEGEDEDRS